MIAPEVIPPVEEAWDLFKATVTQWRVGMSRTGLDYPAVKMVAETLDMEWNESLFCKIKFLELLYLKHSNQEQEKASGSANKNRNKRKRSR